MATTLNFRDNRRSPATTGPLALAHGDVHALQVDCAFLKETVSREQYVRRRREYSLHGTVPLAVLHAKFIVVNKSLPRGQQARGH